MEQRGFGSKHVFKLKFFFSIFSKLNKIKINKADVKVQAYVTLQILCNRWIHCKIRRKIYENVKTWKWCVSIFCTLYFKPSCMEVERRKCYFNVFSPSIHSSSIHILTTIIPERNLFLQNYMKNVVKTDKLCEELSTPYFVT